MFIMALLPFHFIGFWGCLGMMAATQRSGCSFSRDEHFSLAGGIALSVALDISLRIGVNQRAPFDLLQSYMPD